MSSFVIRGVLSCPLSVFMFCAVLLVGDADPFVYFGLDLFLLHQLACKLDRGEEEEGGR